MKRPDAINVPTWLASIIILAGLAWLGWMSAGIIELKADMSAVKQRLQINSAPLVADDSKTIVAQ